ncbi:ESPR-type extended signal peptide-containing protein, partial [Veillonella atypica]|uniref:ESPR-type extended signal peptide-containing protein n=1 Tax=Veillonella atypica TaxID=39777 RepID=UPI00352E921B
MNKIFKVIWSKSKQCYIVVSEIAKNKTGKKKIVVASILAALAMASSVQDVSAVTGSGGTNNFSNAGSGVSFKQGEGLAIGTNATVASGNTNTVAIGVASVANGSSSFAASGGSTASGKDGQIAIGWSSTNGKGAVAIGGTSDTASGRDTRAIGTAAVALGVGSAADGNNTFAASGGNATGESATAIGSSAIASGRGGVAVGWNAESAVNAVGIGFKAKAKANNTVAIGVEANSDNSIGDNSSSVSIGVATRARAVGSMAMGVSADASGKYSIALGSGDVRGDYTYNANYPKATGEKAIAIGYNSNSSNTAATAIGAGATASGQDSFAGGSGTAGGNSSIAIGKSSGATNDRALAVGVNAKATGKDTVAVGSGAGGTVGLGFASSIDDNKGVVQTIKNINVATTADGDNAVAVGHYANAMNSGVALGQNTLAATGGVAIGKGVFEDTNNVDAGGTVIGQDSTVTGFYSLAVGRYTFASGSTSMAMGYDASAKGNYAVAMGRKVIADGTSTAIGHHAVATNGGLAIGSQDNDASKDKTTASASGAVAIGKNTQSTLKGAVALGSDSTTATNATKQESVTINGITYNFAGATSDTGMQVSVGAAGKERQIKNVAAGEVSATSTDAINGSQLFAVASQIKPVNYFSVKSTAAGNKNNDGATGVNAIAIGPDATATSAQSIALGKSASASGTDSIAIGNGSTAANKVAPVAIGQGAKANGDFSVALGGGNHQFVGAIANGVGSTALGTTSNTADGQNYQTVVGFGANTNKAESTAIGYKATVTVEGGVALGANSSSSTGRTVGYNPNDGRTNTYSALTGNVIRSTTGAIAVGNGSTVTRQITGVAAGTNDTDAVNVAQLKSVNLAFKGNVGSGDVNLATNDSNKKLTIQGDRTYITTNASGNTLTISANKKDINVTNGTARADAGVADAKNVAEAINKAVSQNAYNWYLTADNDTAGSRATINKEGTVKFSGDSNITVARNGNTITTSLNKAITVDSVKANKTITVGTNKITLDGNTGAVTGKAFTGNSFTAGDNVLSNTTLQIGSPTGANNVSITRDGLNAKAGTKTVKFGTNGIDAGGQQITNVSSGGNVGTNAANITDVKNYVGRVTLNIKTNSKTGTINLEQGALGVTGANGIRTDLIGTNKDNLVIGLDQNTINATTKGIGLSGDTGTMLKQYLKDGDANYKISGDGALVTTSGTTTGVQVSVDKAKVKDLAVEAVTVSKANTVDNPITVTSTTDTNSKEYAIGIDTSKLAAKTEVTYRANNAADANAKKVSLSKGFNFVDGGSTVATVGNDGKVSFDLSTATKNQINTNTTDIVTNKGKIATNTTNIATNTTNIAHTIALADDKGTSTTAKSLKDGNVSFNIKGDNKYISTAASGNDVTLTVNEQAIKDAAKSASSFKVKANTHAEEEVKGGDTIAFNNGDNIEISQTGKTFTIGTAKNITVDSVTAGNTVINTSGLTNGTTAITGTGVTTDKVTVGGLSIDKTAGINAGGKVISNVASGGTTDSNAANIGDVKQAVANLSQNLNITDGTNNGTVDLKNQKLNVAGANGVTATVNKQTITVGLDANTVNATTKGIGLTADTGSTGNKYLKDGDVSFAVTGDGNLVSTSATAAGVKVAVDAAKVKDLAVAAVTVSKDTQADNPITVTPTAGANSKDYAIGIDTTKLAAKTDLTYRANSAADANAKKVSLSKGLNFVDGDSTVATVDNDGKVSFDLNTATKNQITTNTTDIAANKGKIATNTTNIAANTTALARNISLGADTGTASSQSLSAADVAFNVKGVTGDFVSTNMNGNTVEISTKRATINSNATTGEASVTGNDGLATAQNVADAINKAADAAKAGAAWNITTNSSTTDKTAVKGGDTVDLVNGDNIEITQDGTDKKKITVATKKDITVDSVTANNKVTVGSGANKITLDGTDGSVTGKAFTGTTFTGTSFTGTSFTAGNTVINTNGLTNGTTAITGTGVTTDNVTVGGISIDKTTGINAGNKVISNVASGGTTLTNAANIGDVQNAVANLSQNLNITDGTHNGTVNLKNQKLNVAGANGVTATVNNQTITVGLDANTVNATTKGIGLTADTGSTGNKYLKDGDVSFAVTGDGSLVSTSATAAGVKVAVNSASITAGTDGTITAPTTDGVATAKNVADAINAAKKASKTEITANTGEAANATTGNVTLTSTTAADGHTIYDIKLNDKVTLGTGANAVTIDGTTGAITGKTATIGGVTVNGTANTIGGLSNTTWNGTAVSGRAATEDQLKAATGATTLKFTGDVAANTGSVNLKDDTFGIKGDGKYISTDVNGKNVNLTVSEAEVKKSAVAAVTVSTDTTDTNNPLTVTPTTSADGTTKDYKVTIDGTKIANKTNLSYKANDGTAKQVSLADGLNFKNGTLTTASIDDKGVVKYDVNTASITAGTDGTITGPATDGVATAKNVADAINAAKKASKTEITANTGEAANATTGNVTLTSTTAADGHTIYDVKLNDKVTLGTGANAVTVDGTAAKVTAGVTTVDGATGTITTGGTNSIKVDGATGTVTGLTNKDWTPGVTKAVTGRAATEDQLQKVADAASSQTWNITADKAGTTGAQTGTKKNATVGKDETVELVAGDNLTINQDERKFTYSLNKDLANLTSVSVGTGTTETIKLDGATGKITAKNASIGGVTIDGDNNHVTGLANTTWNGTATSGRAATEDQLKAVADTAKTTTDAVNLKFSGNTNTSPGVVNLKDDTFGIVGDGKYVSTDANGKNLTVKVSEAEVKKSAVAAVTVSTDTTDANNPLTVTPTTSADGTTKDYKVTIDGTKIANKTNLSYKANDGTAKQVSLADGLNFKNGTLTTASIDDAGVVKYDVNTASITAGADGTITGPTTDGVATAQNVADAINAAKKASKTEITANTGEAANATTGNVILTSTTAADGHTIYDVKLNDKVTLGSGANAVTIDGTAGKATIGSSIVDGVNNTFTTGGVSPVTLNGATGTITGKTANIGGVTVNGTANTIGGLSNTTWNGTATTGRAATEDQLKVVADAAGSQTWEITADKDAATSGAQTGTKKNAKVGKDDKVQLIAGENLTVNQNERDFTYSLNKDLVKMNSATFEATGGKTTVIKGDSIVQTDGANVNTSNATSNTITDGTNTSTITAGKAQIGTVGIDGVVSKISTGGTNAVVVNGADGTIKTGNVTVTGGTTNDITGLSNTTVTAADFATKGRAATEEQLKAATGATTLKFTGDVATNTGSVNLKDDTFGIKGDGKYISTDVNGKNVNLTISEAEVKKSAVAAVTVSTDTTDANNPLTVTPTTSADGTTKDYKVTIDGTKIANKTNLSYKANDGTAKQVSLADGLNFKNGTLTTASIDDNGVVKYDVNTASITAGADGTITGPTTDGVATAQNVADAINAAKKASKTEITANAGETANSTKGNVTLTSTTAADGHTIYDVKLNDKVTLGSGANAVTIDGTAGKATIGSSIVDGVNSTFTTGGANAVKLDGAAGTIKTGTVTVTGGTTNDITGLSNTTVTSADFATKGRAATEEQLKAVGEQTWQITADKDATTSGAQTGTKKNAKVGKDDKVQLIAGENLTVNQNERDFTYSLNKDLVKMNSATFEATGGRTTVIKGDSIVQTDGTKVNTSTAGGSTVADGTKSTETTADGQVIKDGAKSNKSTVDSNVIDDGNGNVNTSNATSNTITDGTNTSTVTAGKAQIGTVGIDGVASKITTGGANAVVINGADGTVKTGTVTVIGGTTNDITGLSNTTVTAADFATKGRAATEEQLKAVGEQTWQITADKDATTSGAQTGTKKDAKVGKNDKVQLIAGENMTVNQNERDFTYSLNKDLVKMNSATFEATGGKTTVIKGDSIVQTDGTKVNTSTAAGNTVVDGAKSTATTADGTTVTTANGNTNYAADGVRINTTGKTPVSLTDAGLDNGNNVIKNVASGHVNNDATDNTNAANIADVKKATTTVTANAGEAANATTGNVTLTSTTAADGHTIYDVKLNDKVTLGSGANAVTIDGTAGKATFGSSVVDGVNNTFTTGGANAVKLDGAAGTIKTGTVTVTGGTTNDITGLSNTTVTAADFATKGRAATEEQLKAVGEQTWQITADKDATTSGAQTGTKKDAKVGKNDKVQLIAGENMTVNQNERDFTFTLNKDLVKMNSATFEATGGKTIVIKGDSIVQTDGTKVNTSTAGGNTVADGTKSTETTADGQVIKDGTKTNTSTVDENTLVDGAKSNKATVDSNVVDDGNGNVNTSNATSNTITDGTNRSTITAGKATIGSSVIDGVNNTFTTGGANAVKLDGAAGTIKTGTVTVTGGTTNDITGLSNTTVTAADFATKGRAATEEQLKAVGEQTWQITADKDVTTSGAQTGTKKDAKVGKDDKVQLIAGENMTVNQNERDFTFTLNKDLVKMNSATFEATGGKITVIKGDSIVQTDGTKTNTATASGNTVANGTKSTETTADGQVIKDGAKSNKSTVSSNVIDDGTGNVNTSNATSNTITDGTNTSTITAGKATIGSSIIDGVNNTFTTGGASPVTLNGATGTITGKTANIGGVTVDGTNNHVMGLANKDWTPGVTQAVSGRAATEDQLQKVSDAVGAGWKVNTGKVTGSTGESNGATSTKVASGEEVQFQAGNNLIVDQNGKTVAYSLNKALKDLESATFNGTGTNKTVITGDSITQTAGTQTNTSTAGGNTVADGTKSTETTAAGQVIKNGAKSNKSTVDNNVIDDGTGNVNTSNATSNTITDGTNTTATTSSSVTVKDNAGNSTVITKDNITTGVGGNKITLDGTAGKATIGASVVDGVNNTFTTGGTNAVTMNGAAGTIKTGT